MTNRVKGGGGVRDGVVDDRDDREEVRVVQHGRLGLGLGLGLGLPGVGVKVGCLPLGSNGARRNGPGQSPRLT